MDNLLRDNRHKNIVVILAGDLEVRIYDEWGMGYIDAMKQEVDIDRCFSRPDFSMDLFKEKIRSFDID